MGYELYIGEFHPTVHAEDRCVSVGVVPNDGVSIGAPINSSDNRANECWPSYSQWWGFTGEVGLRSAFYGGHDSTPWFRGVSGEERDGLLRSHPGAAELTEDHRQAFVAARDAYLQRPKAEQDEYTRRRLEWLVWWTTWALKNCQHPTFANS